LRGVLVAKPLNTLQLDHHDILDEQIGKVFSDVLAFVVHRE
jgi:hypothetical protein